MHIKDLAKFLAALLALALLFGCAAKEPVEQTNASDPAKSTEATALLEISYATETSAASESFAENTTTAEMEDTTMGNTTTVEDTISSLPAETTAARTLLGKEALDLFNTATQKAVDARAGYSKRRYTKITELDFGVFSRIPGLKNVVADAVYGFFDVGEGGEGVYEVTVAKGQSSSYLRASKWTMDDIAGAKAEPDGQGGYTVTITVKDGSTRWRGGGRSDAGTGTAASYIDRGPLCYGTDDSTDYDHKTAANFYYTINHAESDFGKPSTQDIGETTSNIQVEAKIDAQGRLTNLKGGMDMIVNVYHVTFVITLRDKYGKGYGTLEYKDFRY